MQSRKLRNRYLTFDLLAALLVWMLFMVFRKTVNDAQIFSNVPIFLPNYNFVSGFLYFPLSCIFVHYLSGFYIKPANTKYLETAYVTFVSSAIVSIVIFFALMLDDVVVSYKYYYYSLVVLFSLLFVITLVPRWIIIGFVQHKFSSNEWKIPTLIIGTGANAVETYKNLVNHSKENLLIGFIKPVGKLVTSGSVETIKHSIPGDIIPEAVNALTEKSDAGDIPDQMINNEVDSADVIQDNQLKRELRRQTVGSLSDLPKIIEQKKIKDVIISLDKVDEANLYKIIHSLYHYNVDIRFTPRLNEILTGGPRIKMMGKAPLVNITDMNIPYWQLSVKRFIDILFSGISLLLLSPVFFFLMMKVKMDSHGPIFYMQERIGFGGKSFKIIKFRTMYVDSENGVPQLSSEADPRITVLGKVLRKYRLDELPQLWNIFKGDMSLVGPRPERKYFIDQIIEKAPYYCLLYKVRPGLTSWGPIRVGYTDTVEKMIERLHYDIIYIENMSLWIDSKIIMQTIEILFKGKGV